MKSTYREFPELGKTLHVLFEEQVQKTPHSLAVKDGDKSLSYQELNEVSNGLALRIGEETKERGRPVGIFLPRCWQYAAAYIGSLKANCGYMPLELALPKAMLGAMLEKALPPVVFTLASLAARLPEGAWKVVLLDDGLMPAPCGQSGGREGEEGDLAYFVFSSGTTGPPKAIRCPHR